MYIIRELGRPYHKGSKTWKFSEAGVPFFDPVRKCDSIFWGKNSPCLGLIQRRKLRRPKPYLDLLCNPERPMGAFKDWSIAIRRVIALAIISTVIAVREVS